MPTVIITGGTGLIGKRLTQMLREKHYDIILFSHQQKEATTKDGITIMAWDIDKGIVDKDAIAKADYIIHLAGANVAAKRWTAKRKQEIVDSRTKSGALLVKALREIPNQVKAVVSASAIGWYGEDTIASREKGFREEVPASNDFLGTTTRLWEESIQPVAAMGKRLVILRTGIVLSKDGGALPEFIRPLRLRVATVLGKGNQVISWLHIDDICRMYLFTIENNGMSGAYNAVAPSPISNRMLVKTLAQVMNGKAYITVRVPAFALKLALGEMSVEVLKGATVSADKIQGTGFQFLYQELLPALRNLMKK